MRKANYIFNRIMSTMMMAFGFGYAARCLFAHYDRMGDKVFYTVMLAAIGFVGMYLFKYARQEYETEIKSESQNED